MTLTQLYKALDLLHATIDGAIDGVDDAATEAQNSIYDWLTGYINNFELQDGSFVPEQDYARRMLTIQNKIQSIIGDVYTPRVKEYLNTYSDIDKSAVDLHKSYNDLEVDLDKVAPARKVIYKEASYWLTKGVTDAYEQPVKYLVMQQVTRGLSIEESNRILKKWNEGELRGELASGTPTPRLQSYASQIARNSAYQFNGVIQDQVQKEYNLQWGVYTGDVIKDSRPLCAWLVRQDRPFSLDEIGKILNGKVPYGGGVIAQAADRPFLSGVIPGTNKKNFPIYRGGYNCRHQWFPIKKPT